MNEKDSIYVQAANRKLCQLEAKNLQLEARVLEQDRSLDLYKVRLDAINSALARLKDILNDPLWT